MLTATIVSTSIAGVAFCLSIWQLLSGRKAIREEEQRRENEVRLLQAQVATLQQLVELQASGTEKNRAAVLTARAGGSSSSEHVIELDYFVRNVGRAAARDLLVWLALVDDEAGAASETRWGESAVPPLAPNDPEVKVTIAKPGPFPGGRVPRDADLRAKWTDEGGDRETTLLRTQVYI
jgi:hypothetical protein